MLRMESVIVSRLQDILPIEMWQLLHAGLVSETGVNIDIVLNRKENGRYVRLRVLDESRSANPFCLHLRKSRAINRLCLDSQGRTLDEFVRKDRAPGADRPLPYLVDVCHAGLFRIAYPLRIHGCIVAFVVVQSLRQGGNEGEVLARLRTLSERAGLAGHRESLTFEAAFPRLAEVTGFAPKQWGLLIDRLSWAVGDIQALLLESYSQRCAEREEQFLPRISAKLPPADKVTAKLLEERMADIAGDIGAFCGLECFAYLRRPRPGQRLVPLATWGWPEGMDLSAFAVCPPLPTQPHRGARPLELRGEARDLQLLADATPRINEIRHIADRMSAVYVYPQPVDGQGLGPVNDLLFFGKAAQNDTLVDSVEAKRNTFAAITRHLSTRLDALYRIIHQQQFIAEMSHEMRAPMSGMFVEIEHIQSLYECLEGELPPRIQQAFDMLMYHATYLDHKRWNWLYRYGREEPPGLDCKPTNLTDILTDVVNVYRPIANREGVLVQVLFSYLDLPTLAVDADLIQSVLANLLDNAIKYTRGMGDVLFQPDDLIDAEGLVSDIRQQSTLVTAYIWRCMTPETRSLLAGYFAGRPLTEKVRKALLVELNRLLVGPPLWGSAPFRDADSSADEREWPAEEGDEESAAEESDEDDKTRLNRILLQRAFSGKIAESRRKQRHIDIDMDDTAPEFFRLSVSNFGVGIRQEWIDQGLIFADGWRVPWQDSPLAEATEGASNRYVGGTGIGLSVVKRIMEQHGGKVDVESHKGRPPNEEPVGERFWSGCKTTFTISFPKNQELQRT